jgi:hypothetical protein
MTRRMKQALLAVAALGALALGGSAIAQAGTTTVKPALEPTSGPDRDKIQSGDQTTPDRPASASAAKASKATANVSTTTKAKSAASEAPGVETAPNSDGPSGPAQETTGTSSAPAETPDTGGETTGSEAPNNDGPGGHADEPGNANADHQFNGQE